jgi:hypothetical protein
MTQHRIGLLLGACTATMLLGCASPSETAIFFTKTSFSLLDADTVPAGVSIAYDRTEGYVGPRFDDGTIFPVASMLETRGSGVNREIRQVYATGKAALIVTTLGKWVDDDNKTTSDGQENKVMVFGTGTTLGLKVGFADTSFVPTSFMLGYRRKEVSVIPVDKKRQPSVLATFDNGSGVGAQPASGKPAVEFNIEQFFATGRAADNLALKPIIRGHFQDSAERAIGEVEKYRNEEARQGRLALDTLSCFSKVGDDKLDQVWSNADALGVFGELGTVDRIRAASSRSGQRQIYTGELGLLDAASPSYTVLLGLHRKSVCDLSASKS